MKKILLLLIIPAVLLTMLTLSCKKEKPEEPTKPYSELIVGRWMTADGGHYEVYDANGTGHMWDPADDVQEDEADQFEWTMEEDHKQFMQLIHFQGGQGTVPQYCNILELTETTFKYNNEGWRATYNLIRVN